MILFGGQTSTDFSRSVQLLTARNGRIVSSPLADLSRPLAMMNAVVAGDRVYLLGGQATFTPTRALGLFLAIPVEDPPRRAGRMERVALVEWPGAILRPGCGR